MSVRLRNKSWLYLAISLLACSALAYLNYPAIKSVWTQVTSRPILWTNDGSFQDTIRDADRLVVRDGGFDCCSSVEGDKVLFEVNDSAELDQLRSNIRFASVTNVHLGACMCCGEPGLDWYEGDNRIALTGMQHGWSIRWDGFSAGYKWPGDGYAGDAPLEIGSVVWMIKWFRSHGITNGDYSDKNLDWAKQRLAIQVADAPQPQP